MTDKMPEIVLSTTDNTQNKLCTDVTKIPNTWELVILREQKGWTGAAEQTQGRRQIRISTGYHSDFYDMMNELEKRIMEG